jgi:hypothetical protein
MTGSGPTTRARAKANPSTAAGANPAPEKDEKFLRLRTALYNQLVAAFGNQYGFPAASRGRVPASRSDHPKKTEITTAEISKIAEMVGTKECGIQIAFDDHYASIEFRFLNTEPKSFEIYAQTLRAHKQAHQFWMDSEKLDREKHDLVYELTVDDESEIQPFLDELKKLAPLKFDIEAIYIKNDRHVLKKEAISMGKLSQFQDYLNPPQPKPAPAPTN